MKMYLIKEKKYINLKPSKSKIQFYLFMVTYSMNKLYILDKNDN